MFYIYKIGKIFYNFLPSWLCYIIARWMGNIVFFITPDKRKNVESNLMLVKSLGCKKAEIKYVTRKIYQNFNICLVDFFRVQKINKSNLFQVIEFRNIENLNKALSHNKGVILLSAHLGNWELGSIGLSILGYPVSVMYLPHTDKRLDNLFIQQRICKGEKIFRIKQDTKRIFSIFGNGEILGIVGDMDAGDSDAGVMVNFLGKKTLFPRGPAVLSVKTGAVIVPAFNIMTSCGKYVCILEVPVIPQNRNNIDEAVMYCTQKFANILEDYIEKYPQQWFVFRKLNSP